MAAKDPLAKALDLARSGDFAAAEAAVNARLAAVPRDAEALVLQAQLRLQRGRAAEAVESADRALRLNQRLERAHWARADALVALGRAAEAVGSYDRAIALKPDFLAALANRGNALSEIHAPERALASFDQALAINPNLPQVHYGRARVLNDLGRAAEAVESADRAIALNPNYAKAWQARGLGLMTLALYSEALESLGRAVQLDPNFYDGLTNLGVALSAVGRYAEALEVLDRAVALAPSLGLARNARAQTRLLLGDFAGGWEDYDHRWNTRAFAAKSAGYVSDAAREALTHDLRPEQLEGRRVLILPEQGIGDHIMFASMIPDVLARAASTTITCERRLAGLFAHSFPGARVVAIEDAEAMRPEDFDMLVAMGSLGRAFRNRREDFPGRPYLAPRPEVVEAWRARLAADGEGRRIGLSWRGGTVWTAASSRSVDLKSLAALLDLKDSRFVSLQYGDPRPEVEAVNRELGAGIRVFDPQEIEDFEQLAGLVLALDGVVTVQTALVHLCGALGQDCAAMVPARPEWRYMARGDSMPWYGSVRIVRQQDGEGWAPVIGRAAKVASEWRMRASGGRA